MKATVRIRFYYLPPLMRWIGKKLSLKVIASVVVIILLSVRLAIDTVLLPFSAKVLLHPCTYLEGAWLKLMARNGGIWFCSNFFAINYKYNSCTSFFNSYDMHILPVVAWLFLNPMRLIRIFDHDDSSILMLLSLNSGWRLIKTIAVFSGYSFWNDTTMEHWSQKQIGYYS